MNVTTILHSQRKPVILSSFWNMLCITKVLPDIEEQPHKEMAEEMEKATPPRLLPRPGLPGGPVVDALNPEGILDQIKGVFLAPRGTFKSMLGVAFCVYLILKYPDVRIMLLRAVQQDAIDMLTALKTMLRNPIIIEIFGDLEEEAKKAKLQWAEDAIVRVGRTRAMTEPTVGTAGLTISKTGKHPDLLWGDDIVNDLNYRSPRIHEKTRLVVQAYYPIVEQDGGSILISGTRWATNDVYGKLLEESKEAFENGFGETWRLYRRSCFDGPDGLFFPTRFSRDSLARIKFELERSADPRLWSAWYLNQPTEAGMEWFPEPFSMYHGVFYKDPFPHLEIWTGDPNDENSNEEPFIIPVRVTASLDPALTSAKTKGNSTDFYGFTVVFTDEFGHWWIHEAFKFRKVAKEASDTVMQMLMRYEPETLITESGGLDAEFQDRLSQGIKEFDLPTTIQSYLAIQDETLAKGMKGKWARIEALNPRFVKNTVHIRYGLIDLLKQLKGYPDLDDDDVIDSLSMQRIIALPPTLTNAATPDRSEWLERREELASRATSQARWLFNTNPTKGKTCLTDSDLDAIEALIDADEGAGQEEAPFDGASAGLYS